LDRRRRAAGTLEAEVLAVLQAGDAALTPDEVRARLSGELSYSTVVTILSRLYVKGVLERARRGRAYAYHPITDAAGLVARRMHRTFADERDHEAVLARFVSDLTPDDEALLRRLLGERGRHEAAGNANDDRRRAG
jgi:predicted transcriptional regulator